MKKKTSKADIMAQQKAAAQKEKGKSKKQEEENVKNKQRYK